MKVAVRGLVVFMVSVLVLLDPHPNVEVPD